MPDRMEAAALALDAYQQHLLGDRTNGHRTDHAEAEGLLHSLVIDLIGYGERNRLDVVDLINALVQRRIDRGGALTDPRYSFRIDSEVQFRDRETDPYRGFITQLTSTGPRGDTQATLRVPGLCEPCRVASSELAPAARMAPVSTRTSGTVFSAQAAEQTLISMLIHQRTHPDSPADARLRADIAELSTALATWSGTTADQVLYHLRQHADQHTADEWPSAARCAAAAFPNDIAADLARQPRPATIHPEPPSPAPRTRLK